jgi:glycosyltransferase involved in cell wall biosynthesis
MQLEVLLSCMNQKDTSLVEKSRITGNVLIINQCINYVGEQMAYILPYKKMITTSESGLSRSRNLAIQHAQGEICLICDDDELLEPDYQDTILQAFQRYPQADVIAFGVKGKETRLAGRVQKLGRLGCLKIVSYQIAFRREIIQKQNLKFDINMGAGSGNGCGEENKFLLDCLKAGLKIYYVPQIIAEVIPKSSTWFFGYDSTFFYQRGGATRYMLGTIMSLAYGIYYLLAKRRLYLSTISTFNATKQLLKGIWDNPIKKRICSEKVDIQWKQ